jgi:hypothetical protein
MLAEAIVILVAVYACATLWPNITLAMLSFVAGVAVDQYNPRTPRVHTTVALMRLAVARLLSRSDDLGTSISQVATSAVAMTSEQAKRLLQQEDAERDQAASVVVAAVATSRVESDEDDAAPAPVKRSVAQSIRDRAVRFE